MFCSMFKIYNAKDSVKDKNEIVAWQDKSYDLL